MFAYCISDPINYMDPNGTEEEVLGWWAATMWWLCGVDGPSPIGDIVYGAGVVILTTVSLCQLSSNYTTNTPAVDPIPASRPLSAPKSADAIPHIDEKTVEKETTGTSFTQYRYWTVKKIGGLILPEHPLTYKEACLWVASLNDILCIDKAAAFGIVKFYPSRINDAPHRCKDGYLPHFHLNNGRLHKHDNHIWYYK